MSTFDSDNYPKTRKDNTADQYFGVAVRDPYRWLEDDLSDETAQWVREQNLTTSQYLEQIPYRKAIKNQLESLWNYEKTLSPFRQGKYTYFYQNSGLQDQFVLYRQSQNGAPEVFLDPNRFSEDGTSSLADLSFSRNGTLAVYTVSQAGSDWRKAYIIDSETKQPVEAPLENIKFSAISWRGDEGFYYSSYDKPDGSHLSAKTDQHKLYFHTLGEPQEKDALVYGGTDSEKHRYVRGSVTTDDNYLIIDAAQSTSGNDLYLVDLSNSASPIKPIIIDSGADTYLLDNKDSKLYLATNYNAPNLRVVCVDAQQPTPEYWIDVIPEAQQVLNPTSGGGYLFGEYMIDTLSKVYQFDYMGNKIREVTLPDQGSATGFTGKTGDPMLYYSFSNYKTPPTLFELDPHSGESSVYHASKAQFDPDQFVSTQVFYTSKDGTQVPMMITHKKGLTLTGDNPTILYGYGGFNISLRPEFSVVNAVWMALGGVYAVPNLRGGGEYGKQWHKAGTLQNKQNVFDDFISAAQYLIEQRYTSKEYLAVRGGSNGGLLVGAAMTQRPDLMQVALPAVGVLDMLRYHTFTSGAGWAYDYGTSEQTKDMFEYLKGYSPLHNLKQGTQYPATLVTTGDHDDRVVPAHSFKFAATLQECQVGTLPTLIRIETDAGHGAGTPVSKIVEQYADLFAFALFNMGIETIPESLDCRFST